MAETKRAWKLHEFVAHGSNVNCVSLGRKSGRVLATGGEDRKVNLWSVDKPNCIMTLQGHTTPVECVRFGQSEEMVVAGSVSGALKVWDLEQAKIMRTLTGHKAAITSLDFHPFGDYTASASLDSNIKLCRLQLSEMTFDLVLSTELEQLERRTNKEMDKAGNGQTRKCCIITYDM